MSTIIGSAESDDEIEIIISTVPFNSQIKSYWGWMSTPDMLVVPQIVVLQGTANFATGTTITANFQPANAAPMYLYMAERASEPTKTKWFANDFDFGNIGPGQTFYVLGEVGGWRVYRTTGKTQFSTTTEFRIS